MSLRVKYLLYMVFVHLLLAVGAWYWVKDHPLWLYAAEVGLLISAVLSWLLYRAIRKPERLLQQGIQTLREQDFQQQLRPTGVTELDELIGVYNQLVAAIRQERHTLQEQHFFLEKLIDAVPSGILLLDYDGNLTYLNPAAKRLLGVEHPRLGLPVSEIAHPLAEFLQRLSPGQSEIWSLSGNAQYKCQAAHFIHRGFPRRFLVVEELTRELLEVEKKAYGKVIRMMAHEVNNSVGAINSILQSVKEMGDEGAPVQQDLIRTSLEVAIDRNRAMNQFMQNFSRVIRVPAPQRQQVVLGDLLRKTGTLLEPEAVRRGIVLLYDLPMTAPTAQLDPDLMEQAVLNMARNAMESIGDQGEIRFSVHLNPLRFSVADNGPGISPEAVRHLFTPFFSTKPQGQGIGLALIREIMHQHGLRYSLETRPDGWTVFEVVCE